MIETIVGFLTGIFASMGLGGGFVLVIYLAAFTATSQLDAQGTNLLFFLPIALLSVILHNKNKLIQWKQIPVYALYGILGAIIGFWISTAIDETLIAKGFAVFILIFGIKELFHKKAAKDVKPAENSE